MSPLIETIAREMATEAHCFGLSHISYDESAEERKDAWRAIAVAGLMSLRNELGPTIVDSIVKPEGETTS